jgi:hypothetical protein
LSVLLFFVFAFGIFALWFATHASYRALWNIWLEATRSEAARHPISLANLKPFFLYSFLSAPLVLIALPFAVRRELRERGWSLLLTISIFGFVANLLLFFNYSTIINWRYFVTGLPAMVPLAGDYLARMPAEKFKSRRLGFVVAISAVIIVAFAMGILLHRRSSDYLNRLAFAKDYQTSLNLVPKDAVMISGAQTVAVTYFRGLGVGQWGHIGVGAGWPAGLVRTKIEEHLKAGRRVFLDADPRWWHPCPWHQTEIAELVTIEPYFRFRQISPTIFEIRPADDLSATDQPHLERLLPENRSEEVKRCF